VTRARFIVVLTLVSIIVVVLVLMRGPEPEPTFRVTGLAAQFMKVLPSDLPPDHVAEIEGLLARFQYSVRRGQMPVADEVEIKRLLTRYVDEGSISHHDLNLVMARVGYYTLRGTVPDSIGLHPLLKDSLPR
jgi:hypothetical protein